MWIHMKGDIALLGGVIIEQMQLEGICTVLHSQVSVMPYFKQAIKQQGQPTTDCMDLLF